MIFVAVRVSGCGKNLSKNSVFSKCRMSMSNGLRVRKIKESISRCATIDAIINGSCLTLKNREVPRMNSRFNMRTRYDVAWQAIS